jgi:hypothetical protein
MGVHWGVEGQVKLGANTVAEVLEWEFTQKVDPVDDTSMGDTARTHIAGSGIQETEGSILCHWDETDTNGQVAMVVGASLTLNLYPEGSSSGDKYYSGLVSITSLNIMGKLEGETTRASFTWKANGAFALATA